MPVVLPAHLATLGKCSSPDEFKAKVWELLGPAIANYTVCNSDVLFVTYIPPGIKSITRDDGSVVELQLGGDASQQEHLFQGNVGLVIGMGPLVNKYDSRGHAWESHQIELNQWIVVRYADCWEMHVDGASCRLIDPENIRGIIDTPEIITHRPTMRQAGTARLARLNPTLAGATALSTAFAPKVG